MKKLESIQALRAVAVLLVVGWHVAVKANVLGYFDSTFFYVGNAGVDVFFVLSGFIMALSVNGDGRQHFFLKRLIRIFPVYWLVSFVALTAYVINPHLVNSHAANTTLLNSFTLFPVYDHAMLVDVGWTLRYEILFYMTLWLSLMISPSHPVKLCSAIIVLIVGCGFHGEHSFYKDFVTNPVLIEFLYGFIAYQCYVKFKTRTPSLGVALIMIGFLLFLTVALCGLNYHRCIIFGIPALFLVAGASLLKLPDNIFSRVTCFIGDASYSIYLTHMFSLGFVLLVARWMSASSFVVSAMLVSVIAGCMFYWVVEKNIIRLLRSAFRFHVSS